MNGKMDLMTMQAVSLLVRGKHAVCVAQELGHRILSMALRRYVAGFQRTCAGGHKDDEFVRCTKDY